MVKKRTISFKIYLLLLLPILFVSYLLSGLFVLTNTSLKTLPENIEYIVTHFYHNWWNDKTPAALAAGVLLWVLLVSYLMYHYRNFQTGREYGNEDWADAFEVDKKRRDPERKNNRILSRNLAISLYGDKKLSNNNLLVIGSSGTYKTNSVVTPNLLMAAANYIVLDVKGELMYKYGNYLGMQGYTIRCLNLKDPDKSCQYNPFEYIEKEEDLIRLITNIQDAVNPPDSAKGDPFWQSGPALYLQSIFYYEWYTKKEQGLVGNMNNILTLANMETKKAPVPEGTDPNNAPTMLAVEMEKAKEKYGEDFPAVRDYRKLKEGATETVRSIIIIVNAMLKLCEVKGIKRIFQKDELNLREFATGVGGTLEKPNRNKLALFLIIPDNDQSFNYIISMLYTQAFDILMRIADNEFRSNGGALPIPIEFWMDEFYAGARPYKPEALMGVVRSRNISMIPILQSVAQLKALFPNDRWQVLMDNCAVMMFLGAGAGAEDTHKYISELLGKQTIDTVTDGKSGQHGSTNYNRMGRELMTPSEVRRMERKDCIIFMEGEQPIYDRKALPWEMPEEEVPFQEAMALDEKGGYVNPVHVVEDKKTGELFTVKEDKAPIREVKEGGQKAGKIYDFNDFEFDYMNFQKSRGQRA